MQLSILSGLVLPILLAIVGAENPQIQVSSSPKAVELPYSVGAFLSSFLFPLVSFETSQTSYDTELEHLKFSTLIKNKHWLSDSVVLSFCWRIVLLQMVSFNFCKMISTAQTRRGMLSLRIQVDKLPFLPCEYIFFIWLRLKILGARVLVFTLRCPWKQNATCTFPQVNRQGTHPLPRHERHNIPEVVRQFYA